MLFNTFDFFLFLPIVFSLYWFVFNRSLRWQNGLLLLASYFFYGWWSWKFMGLLMLSTMLDFIYGFGVASSSRKKATFFLWLSIINNLGLLGIFKYYNFFAEQFQHGFELLGIHTNPILLNVTLPVGISFYTFHGMSYVFDIYRGKQNPIHNFIDYAVFVCFFPLLVAGPIERANHLLPQVQKPRSFSYTQAVEGCRLFLWGLFKKVVIADSLADIVNRIFANYHDYNAITLISGVVIFSFQIYGDFSGYSDIALGTAKLFGFELLSNFKFPYFARDVAEFWRRWHISLSSWFRDYLYIPLGGSKQGKYTAVRNTFVIFLVSGFWHGASWNFIVWGLLHACGFLPLLLLNRNRIHVSDVVAQESVLPSIKEFWQMISTFAFVTFAWLFFRADGIGIALDYMKQIAMSITAHPTDLLNITLGKKAFIYIAILIVADWYLRRNERALRVPQQKLIRIVVYLLMLASILDFIAQPNFEGAEFIYFQF